MYIQYNIVFTMKLVIVLLLIAVLWVLILCVYDMTDTALGNAGLNVKPISCSYFADAYEGVIGMDKNYLHRNEEIGKAITKYANANSDDMITEYFHDIQYSLYEKGLLEGTTNPFRKNSHGYDEIPDTELEYYIKNIPGSSETDAKNIDAIEEFIDNDSNTKKNAIEHFIRQAKKYLVEESTQSKQLNTEALGTGIKRMDINNKNVHAVEEFIHAGSNAKKNLIKKIIKHNYLLKESMLAKKLNKQALDTGIEKKSIFKFKIPTKYFKPITAVAGTLAGLGTIGGISYEVGKANAMKNISKDIKDSTHTHMTLFGILVIVCSVVATFAVCVSIVYYITRKKQQLDMAYSVIGLR